MGKFTISSLSSNQFDALIFVSVLVPKVHTKFRPESGSFCGAHALNDDDEKLSQHRNRYNNIVQAIDSRPAHVNVVKK